MTDTIHSQYDDRGVATLTLNRPEKHNAFDDTLIAHLTGELKRINDDESVRVIILTGAGKSFSSGADVNWMRSMTDFSEEENFEDAARLAELLSVIKHLNKPVIARVNGHAFGGGLGLVACCDIAIGVESAKLAFTEVRLGLVPAVISPYVIAAIGERQARRYFLSAETIDATRAVEIGLLHEVTTTDQLDDTVEKVINALLKGGPKALAAAKHLVATVTGAHEEGDQKLRNRTTEIIAQLRVSDEGQEGLSAYLEKRPPHWQR